VWCDLQLSSILPELAIDDAAIKPLNPKPVSKEIQLRLRIVDILVVFDNGQEPFGTMDDGEVLTQGEKRLRATTLFGWRCPRTSSTDRIGLPRIAGQDLLNADLVPPQVAEVVFVGKALVRAEAEVGETRLPGSSVKEIPPTQAIP
jgi:hypothetical protein